MATSKRRVSITLAEDAWAIWEAYGERFNLSALASEAVLRWDARTQRRLAREREPRRRPYVCPVCGGSGQVPERTYVGVSETETVACRTCRKTGIIWG